jgi:hypothetical protein
MPLAGRPTARNLCEDRAGTHVIPSLCKWSDGTWQKHKLARRLEVEVIG